MIGGIFKKVDYRDILNRIPQEDIFYLAFGYYPEIGKKYHSPFRPDSNAGCRFEWKDNLLFFYDNAGYNGKIAFTAFDAIQIIYNLKSLPDACKYIEKHLGTTPVKKVIIPKEIKREIKIGFTHEPWTEHNNIFKEYYIPHELLNQDKETYCVKDYWCNTKADSNIMRNRFFNPKYFPTVAYHLNGRTKLYWPTAKHHNWYTNCIPSDLFDLDLIDTYDKDYLIITKSKKDALVLKVLNKQVIATQSEVPDIEIGYHLKDKFDTVFILYDNDDTGLKMSNLLCKKYGFTNIVLPSKEKDISDFIKNKGIHETSILINSLL